MGARSPENDDHGHHGHGDSPSLDGSDPLSGGEKRGSHLARDGDGCLGNGGGDDEESDGDDGEVDPTTADAETTQKKRRKRNKKKSKKKSKANSPLEQTSPPRIPLDQLFPSGNFPEGEVQHYQATSRTTTAEHRHGARQKYWEDGTFLRNYRKAAEIHRQTRRWVHEFAKPGVALLDIAEGIEDSVRALLDNSGLGPGDGLKSGMGFPTGLCLNNQVAHYTPNPGQKPVVLQQQDVLTVDFGVQINGWIVDSAFTTAFDPTYDNLLAAVKDATNTGVKTAGIDVRISDVSAAIQEVMESYEVEIRGKTYRVKPIRNLSGHNIAQYRIHGGKSIPFIKTRDQTKMEEGEVFAIETFGSTGRGYIVDDVGIYGYGLSYSAPSNPPLTLSTAKRLHKTIREKFGTIVFCRRYLERLGVEKYLAGMNHLVQAGVVDEYEPLMDVKGSYSAQFEHTFLLRETHKEILSRGDDY
ncbi:peptidase M24, structural domain-containing protein [Chaetomium sp. MPI-SDFR-AT-0129]|nr:peptidase M24, structural domain-containing protein [Chaetomium sp. MPI-SDFR-AT-0129]